jgi:hypothetical protein
MTNTPSGGDCNRGINSQLESLFADYTLNNRLCRENTDAIRETNCIGAKGRT